MAELTAAKRATLPDSAFAYVDSKGRRRLPINDEAHTRNALARFERVSFEDEAARERARRRLLSAARKYGIVPIGFISGQIAKERVRGRSEATPTEARPLPTGVLTLLMTDIERSTELLSALGERYAALLERVRTLLRAAVGTAGGHEVDVRADELFAVFASTTAALEAAQVMQRSLVVEPWADRVDVRVRIGIHHGEPTLTDTGYVGLAVHTAARICSAAHGGQILLSAATREAIDRTPPAGVTFRDLGAHRLHGLPDAVQLFQADHDGSPRDFPPPRAFTEHPRGSSG